MKNLFRTRLVSTVGIIALFAVIGFSAVSCETLQEFDSNVQAAGRAVLTATLTGEDYVWVQEQGASTGYHFRRNSGHAVVPVIVFPPGVCRIKFTQRCRTKGS